MNNWENKYNLNVLNPLIFECDFPKLNLLQEYRDDIIINYAEKINPQIQKIPAYSVLYTNPNIIHQLQEEYNKIITHHFNVSPLKKEIELYTYVQTNNRGINRVHNHFFKATISTTLYLGIPKIGGELVFFIQGEKFYVKPKPNKLYIFPSWLYHQSTPHKDNITRICINVDFFYRERPSIKFPLKYLGEENFSLQNEYLW